MKLRYGFVSNSSSASYIVTIKNISFDEFSNDMFSEFVYDYFADHIKEDLQISEKLKDHLMELLLIMHLQEIVYQ